MSMKKHDLFLPCIFRTSNSKNPLYLSTSTISVKSYIMPDTNSFLTKNQIESCKKIINRVLKKKKINYSTQIQYNLVKTKKSIGSRMGKGKGKISDNVAFIKKNNILFEFTNIPLETLKELVWKIRYKMPISISWKSSSFQKNIYI